jgi:hypothetical protein
VELKNVEFIGLFICGLVNVSSSDYKAMNDTVINENDVEGSTSGLI